MKVTVFSCIKKNRSLDRYAQELARNFPPETDVHLVSFEQAPGVRGRILDHLKYRRIAAREQGDINVIVSPTYAFLLGAVDPSKTLIVCHDIHPLCDPEIGDLRHRIYSERYRRQLRRMQRAAWTVTVSEFTRRELLRLVPGTPADKVVAIHNGLDARWKRITDETVLADFRRKHGLHNKRVVLHVGNDVWYKNLQAVVRAFAKLGKPDFTLVHAGNIGRETLSLVAQLGLNERFLQLQAVDDAELMTIYSIADVLIFPSLSEGFGWPPLEAMACGCPVVAGQRASLPEVLGDASLYVDPTDIDSIADAARRVMTESSVRADLIARGLEQARLFSWQATTRAMLALFEAP